MTLAAPYAGGVLTAKDAQSATSLCLEYLLMGGDDLSR